MTPEPMLYRPRDAARLIGVSTATLYRLVRRGEITAKLPRGCTRGMRVKADDLARYVDSIPDREVK
jgi:excisionase family DNA binding protein